MRRWLLWAGGVFVGCAVLLVALALVLGTPKPPFRFLDSQEPRHPEPGITIFSYKANYNTVLGKMRAELPSHGYKERADDEDLYFERITKPNGADEEVETVF